MSLHDDLVNRYIDHPNITVHTKPWTLPIYQDYGCDLPNLNTTDGCPQWRKYIIQGATPNDTKLDFSLEQRLKIPKSRTNIIPGRTIHAYPKPFGNDLITNVPLGKNTDFSFCRIVTPNFPIWLEKIKICLHQHCTFGCVKVNVWLYPPCSDNEDMSCIQDKVTPFNLIGLDYGQGVNSIYNFPVNIIPNNKLISNALNTGDTDRNDIYMEGTDQTTFTRPMYWNENKPSWITINDDDRIIIPPKSIIEYGIQYAESDAYGLKIFLVGWALECDLIETDFKPITSYMPTV